MLAHRLPATSLRFRAATWAVAGSLALCLLALLFCRATTTQALLNKPDAVFFGAVELEGAPAPVGTIVSAWLGDVEIDHYALGDGEVPDDLYILRIPVAQITAIGEAHAGAAVDGDTVAVLLNGRFSASLQVIGGKVTQRDLSDGPAEIPDLVLWLDAAQIEGVAENGAISLWQDRSGHGHDASQATVTAQPRYVHTGASSQAALRFDGGDYLANATFNGVSGAAAATAFVVRQTNSTSALSVAFSSASSGVRSEIQSNAAWAYAGLNRGGSAAFTSTAWHLWSSVFDGTQTGNANRLKQFIDGTQSTLTFPLLTILSTLPAGNGYQVGHSSNILNSYWNGDIAEIMVYSRVLDSAERQRVESYVAHKFAISAIPIGGQPTPTPTFTPGPPPPPTPLSPAGATSQNPPTFQWTSVTGALEYFLAVYDDNTASYLTLQTVSGTSFTPAAALDNTHSFKWKVRARNSVGWGVYSAWQSFSITSGASGDKTPGTSTPTPTVTPVAVPDPPVPLNPVGTMTTTAPLLTWTAVGGAQLYEFELSDTTSGVSLYAGQTPATSFQTPSPLDPTHAYRWRVRAMNGVGWSAWSGWLGFDIKTGQTSSLTPQPLNPSGIIGDMTPTFVWMPVQGALEYSLTVYDANLEAEVVAVISGAPSGETIDSLSPTHSYRWRVRARTADGWGDESPWQTFSIARCAGDCDTDGAISVSELVRSVNVALGKASIGQCGACDSNSNGGIEIAELITAVRNALNGCF